MELLRPLKCKPAHLGNGDERVRSADALTYRIDLFVGGTDRMATGPVTGTDVFRPERDGEGKGGDTNAPYKKNRIDQGWEESKPFHHVLEIQAARS